MTSFPGAGDYGGGGFGENPTTPGTGTDQNPQVPSVIRSNPETNDLIKHDWSRLLLALLLRIFPRTDIKTELADHGLKAEPDTPEAVLQSPEIQRLAVRPQQVPFAEADLNPGYFNPRRSLRVSR